MSKTMLFLFNTVSLTYTDEDMHGEQLNIVYGTGEVMAKKDYVTISLFETKHTMSHIYRISHICKILMARDF